MMSTRQSAVSPRQLLLIVMLLFVWTIAALQEDGQSNVCLCMKKDDTPTLQKLTRLDVPEIGISIEILQRIGTNYDTLGTFLLNDNHGDIIRTIKHDLRYIEPINREIFYRWIRGGKSTTWVKLVDCLKDSGLVVLAEQIERVLHFCSVNYVGEECPITDGEDFLQISAGTDLPWKLIILLSSVLLPVILGVAVFVQCKYTGYTNYLKDKYKDMMQQGCVGKDHWPPPVVITFFRLAMIKEKEVKRYKISSEFVRQTITGKQDDILREKEQIELEGISKNMKEWNTLLLEGAPGCGKSTLALHICQQWQEGKLFQEYKLVVLVKLRDNAVLNAKNIADLLPKNSKAMGRETEEEITRSSQHLLFVLDGWDEIPEDAPGRSIIMDILKKDKLPKRSIIITSRPTSSADLYELVSVRIEIVGFTPSELKQYFTQCLENKIENAELLLQTIKKNPSLAAGCYIPLYASILVHVFKATGELPKTQFGIFTALIRNCIYRHQEKIGQPIPAIKSLDELPEQVESQFRELCRLAHKAIMEDRIIFENLGPNFNTLGLLQGVASLADGGISLSHNFLHLSIQELLAAIHMATRMTPENQVEEFRELFGRARFAAVFTFYSAKTKLNTPGIDQVLVEAVEKCLEDNRVSEFTLNLDSQSGDLSSAEEPKPLLLSLMYCLHEAEDEQLYQSVIEKFTNSKLDLRNISLNPADCLVVGSFLTHTTQFKVNLSYCSIGDEECKTLFGQDGDYDIHTLILWNNTIGEEGAKALSGALKNLRRLNLGYNEIGEEGAKALSRALKMKNLQWLSLNHNAIGEEGAKALSVALENLNELQELHLFNNPIGEEGTKALSGAFETMTNLQVIGIGNNAIGEEGAKVLSGALKSMTNLKKLDIGNNPAISEVGREALEKSAKKTGTKIFWY